MRRLLTFMALSVAVAGVKAQDDLEYRMEVGAGPGLLSYEGDFNGSIVRNVQPAGVVMLRRIFNPYMGLRLSATYGKLKGTSGNVKTYYPAYVQTPYKFDRQVTDVSLTYEYNFWPYGTGRDYRGAKCLTPFVFAGIGATYVGGGEKDIFTANVPLGVGMKYKLDSRLNLGVEWVMHFSLSDELDGVNDPYGVKSSGAFKNADCYSVLAVTLTYSFMPKCKTCNKD